MENHCLSKESSKKSLYLPYEKYLNPKQVISKAEGTAVGRATWLLQSCLQKSNNARIANKQAKYCTKFMYKNLGFKTNKIHPGILKQIKLTPNLSQSTI